MILSNVVQGCRCYISHNTSCPTTPHCSGKRLDEQSNVSLAKEFLFSCQSQLKLSSTTRHCSDRELSPPHAIRPAIGRYICNRQGGVEPWLGIVHARHTRRPKAAYTDEQHSLPSEDFSWALLSIPGRSSSGEQAATNRIEQCGIAFRRNTHA